MNSYLEKQKSDHDEDLIEHKVSGARTVGEEKQKIGLCRRLKKDMEYRLKFLTFLCLVYSFFILGWILGQFGPSLFDLQMITSTDLEESSFFYMSHNIGYLVGSIVSGFLIGRCDCNLLLAVTMTMYSLSVVAIPWCFHPPIMLCTQAIRGLAGGLLDTVANSELLSLFGTDANPYMQAMHLSFAVGGIVSPLITAPFLAEDVLISLNSSCINISLITDRSISSDQNVSYIGHYNDSKHHITSLSRSVESSQIYIPYTLTAVLTSFSAISFLIVYIKSRRFLKKSESRTDIKRNERKLSTNTKIVVLLIMSVIFLLYTAMEDTVGTYVATFSVAQIKMTKREGSYVTALFWALFTLGRVSGILIGSRIKSVPLVGIYSVTLMISFILLSFTAAFDTPVILWASTALSGFAMSILFPTLFTWTEEDFLLVTGKIASLFIMTSTAGSIASPATLGYLIEEVSPIWYAYILLGESIGVVVFFVIAVILKKNLPQLKDPVNQQDMSISVQSSLEQSEFLHNKENDKCYDLT